MTKKTTPTRKQKMSSNPAAGPSKSQYALKVERRRELARQLGESDQPLPVLAGTEETPEETNERE